jgi:hypothetical protein
VEEEEEESSCRRDRGANKEEHMDHPYVISSPLLLPIFGSPYKKKEKIPKKKKAQNGTVLNDTILLLPLDMQQGKKKVFEFVFFPRSLSQPNIDKSYPPHALPSC